MRQQSSSVITAQGFFGSIVCTTKKSDMDEGKPISSLLHFFRSAERFDSLLAKEQGRGGGRYKDNFGLEFWKMASSSLEFPLARPTPMTTG